MRRRKTKNALTVRAEQALIQQLPIEEKTLRRVRKMMDPGNIKRLAIAAAGGSLAFSVLGSIGRTRVFRLETQRELKKQLDPIIKKLDELERQNEELRQQNEALQKSLAAIRKA